MEHFILSRLASLLKGFQVGQGFGRVKRVALKHFLSSASSSDLFYYGKTKVEPILWAKIEPLLANVPSEQQEKVQSALDKLNEASKRLPLFLTLLLYENLFIYRSCL